MRRALLLAALSLAIACRGAPPAEPRDATCDADSLRTVLAAVRLERDSAVAARRRQAGLTAAASEAMLRYAKIVQRDPTQSRFIVGWTRRAFDGVAPTP